MQVTYRRGVSGSRQGKTRKIWTSFVKFTAKHWVFTSVSFILLIFAFWVVFATTTEVRYAFKGNVTLALKPIDSPAPGFDWCDLWSGFLGCDGSGGDPHLPTPVKPFPADPNIGVIDSGDGTAKGFLCISGDKQACEELCALPNQTQENKDLFCGKADELKKAEACVLGGDKDTCFDELCNDPNTPTEDRKTYCDAFAKEDTTDLMKCFNGDQGVCKKLCDGDGSTNVNNGSVQSACVQYFDQLTGDKAGVKKDPKGFVSNVCYNGSPALCEAAMQQVYLLGEACEGTNVVEVWSVMGSNVTVYTGQTGCDPNKLTDLKNPVSGTMPRGPEDSSTSLQDFCKKPENSNSPSCMPTTGATGSCLDLGFYNNNPQCFNRPLGMDCLSGGYLVACTSTDSAANGSFSGNSTGNPATASTYDQCMSLYQDASYCANPPNDTGTAGGQQDQNCDGFLSSIWCGVKKVGEAVGDAVVGVGKAVGGAASTVVDWVNPFDSTEKDAQNFLADCENNPFSGNCQLVCEVKPGSEWCGRAVGIYAVQATESFCNDRGYWNTVAPDAVSSFCGDDYSMQTSQNISNNPFSNSANLNTGSSAPLVPVQGEIVSPRTGTSIPSQNSGSTNSTQFTPTVVRPGGQIIYLPTDRR